MPRVLGLLRARRSTLDSAAVRTAVELLRHYAHDTDDPELRASVHVACAHLSAHDFAEAEFALETVARRLAPHPGGPASRRGARPDVAQS